MLGALYTCMGKFYDLGDILNTLEWVVGERSTEELMDDIKAKNKNYKEKIVTLVKMTERFKAEKEKLAAEIKDIKQIGVSNE